jgi:FAD-dependent urate hydroxylase
LRIGEEEAALGNALVCGGGVGGLSVGLALKRAGFHVTVFERHPELRTAGVGLNLWPNGVRVLQDLGVGEEFERIANIIQRWPTFSSDGELVTVEDVGAYRERFGAPLTGLYRKDLNALIADALGAGNIRYGHELVNVEDHGQHVECMFANGERVSGDVLIGADGVYSRVRTLLFGQAEFRGDDHVRWRGLFKVEDAGIDPVEEVDVIGDTGHLGWLPIGKGLAYWYAAGEGLDTKEAALAYYRSWTSTPVPKLIDVTPDENIIRNELIDFAEPLERWSVGRITLLGDAAHPMLPGVAQGASQALEDAVVLTERLMSNASVEEALQAYESARMDRANRIVEISRYLFDYDEKLDELDEIQTNPIHKRYYEVVEAG